MSVSPTTTAAACNLAVREPAPGELERVLYLFRNVPFRPQARFLVAVRQHPVERFIAAAAWWPEGTIGRFKLTCQPGVARDKVAGALIQGLADCAREAGLGAIQYAGLLAEDNEWFGILRNDGFQSSHSERSFEVPIGDAWARVLRLYQKHLSQIPPGWRAQPIRTLPPETALELVAPHRLMPPAELLNYWRAESAFGFELDVSCILFDGGRPLGALLCRQIGDSFYIDVRVMREPNPRLRSLGNISMIYQAFVAYHEAVNSGGKLPVRWLRFRGGAAEHRETASFAQRMGGRERARGHLMSLEL
jgi:hypothetical protein